MYNFKITTFLILFTFGFSESFSIKPVLFSQYLSSGSDWMIKDSPISIYGAGLDFFYQNKNLTINSTYLQLSLFGNIDNSLFSHSYKQSLPYIDKSKDADGYWSEIANAKISYNLDEITLELGKYDKVWGNGIRSIHISNKAPSYPQFGLEWKINNTLKLTYFHGFLESGIIDSLKNSYYQVDGNLSRSSNIRRSIAGHRFEWKPNQKITFSLNETVVYALRALDINYMIPIIPFYPIENYLGDTDNLQMGFDFNYKYSSYKTFYLSFFMDEFTPEWLFKNKNHNWFAYQIGYHSEIFFNKSIKWGLEYNWTDQRIYKHKFKVNDFYSHNQSLGFWAGPHAQEFIFSIETKIKEINISFTLTDLKRGIDSLDTIQENYNDLQPKRFDKSFIIEKKRMKSLRIRKNLNKELLFTLSLNHLNFINSFSNKTIRTGKSSFDLALFYNFKIKPENKSSYN